MKVAICTSSSTACNLFAEIRVFGRRKQNLRVSRKWKENHFWVRFASKLHHVLIKSIRMLNTLSLSTYEVETSTKNSIRSNSRFLQQILEIFESSRATSLWLRFVFVVVEMFWIEMSWLDVLQRYSPSYLVKQHVEDDIWNLMWHTYVSKVLRMQLSMFED